MQRRLGLPIHQMSACDAAAAESLGDELLKNIQHTSRHNKVVAAWVRATRAARGAAHTRATSEAPDWERAERARLRLGLRGACGLQPWPPDTNLRLHETHVVDKLNTPTALV